MIKFIAKSILTIAVVVLFGYFAFVYIYPKLTEHQSKQKETFLVKRVIDGDTFELESKERVRMLGIDTPEKYESSKLDKDAGRSGQDKKTLQKLGDLASQYTKKLIEGKRVQLVPEPNYEDKDVYGRLLRYVYLEDGTFINRKIVEDGYAYAYRKYKISQLDEFIRCENDARANKRGLWGEIGGLKQFDDKPKTDKQTPKKKDKSKNK